MTNKPRVPDIVKIAKGTFRPGRQNKQQPAADGIPACPFEAGTIAEAKWNEIVAGLQRLGVIDKIDGLHIQGLCQAYQLANAADALIATHGIIIDGKKNPACTVSADAWAKVRAFGNDLGLCHLARQRLIALPEKQRDEVFEKYFGRSVPT